MTTKDKSHTPTQTELIEAELEPILDKLEYRLNNSEHYTSSNIFAEAKKDLAALVLKHRHDVYFAAYRDGLTQGRKEGKAQGIAALEGLTFYDRWNKPDELPAEITKRIALLKGDNDRPTGK